MNIPSLVRATNLWIIEHMMRFSKLYQDGKFHFSLEIFPPKTRAGVDKLFHELNLLKSIHPAYVSVTYGAMGSTRDLTKDLALQIYQELKMNIAFHFTCVGSGKNEIRDYVTDLHAKGIKLVVALRGDKPTPDYVPPPDGFHHANELVSYLHKLDDFSIAVAGYPEKHIEAGSLESDLENLKRKVDAGAEIIITQLFFDNSDYYSWLEKVYKKGITIPVIAGIMPILNLNQIQRITKMCGAKLPQSLIHKLEKVKDDEFAMKEVGIEHATLQCLDLIQNKSKGIHFYCLNQSHSVLRIVENCDQINLISR